MRRGHRRLMASVTGSKSSLTVAAPNIGDGSEPPNLFDVRLVNLQLSGLLRSARTRQWKRPSPARGAALRMFSWMVQGRRAARRPPSRRPSRFPRPRVPRTERTLTQVAQGAAGNPSTNARSTGDAYEATRPGRARPGGPGPHDPRTSKPGEQPGLTFGCHTRRHDSWSTWKRT